ncbi:tetratricopeptide repeat protein [Methanosarcina mazei]|nr:tetratricopeptide repeat protein [Methanosarcina mazei]KKG07023.1 hypothetical protein DU47_04250 [Methanosarcina mazei]KKH91389.1 hypothetical protein DU80_11625 [Methanosarcina mazei]
MQNGKFKEALNEIEKAEKPIKELNEPSDILLFWSTKGNLLYQINRYEEALNIYILALKTSENLLSKEPDNKIYQSVFMVSFIQVFVFGNTFHKMGRFLQAENCYEIHLAISQRLLKTSPKNISYQATLATTLNDFGGLLTNMGRFKEAKQRFEKALEIRQNILKVTSEEATYQSDVAMTLNNLSGLLTEMRQNILKIAPEEATYQSDVAMTLNNLGGLLTNMGHVEEAKKRLEKALEIRQNILKKYPENLLYQSYVGSTLVNLGALLKDMGRLEEAKGRYEEALEVYEKLVKEEPEDTTTRINLAGLLDNLGNLLTDMGRTKEARQWYEKTLKIRHELLEEDSENIAYQSYLGHINNSIGNFLKDRGLFEEAKNRYEEALKLKEAVLKSDPENVEYQSDVAITTHSLGNLFENTGNSEEAEKEYKKALEIFENLLEADPKNVKYQKFVAAILNSFGILLSATGRNEEAERKHGEALETYEELLKIYPENVSYQSDVSNILHNLGNLLFDVGRIKKAKERLERALEVRQSLLESDPKNGNYQTDVESTLNSLGNLLANTEHYADSKENYEKALSIGKRLLESDPENTLYQSDVAMTLNNLGNLLHKTGHIEEAKVNYEKVLEIYENLHNSDSENLKYKFSLGTTLNNLGYLLCEKEEYSSALKILLRSQEYALNSSNASLLCKIYGIMGRCYEGLNDYNQAFNSYKKSVEYIESIREQYSLEENKLDILWDKSHEYSNIISFLCTKMSDPGKAWEYLECFKSRTLLDSLRLLELEDLEGIPVELQKQEKKLLESRRVFDKLIRKTENLKERDQLTKKIKKNEAELNEIYDQIREISPEYVDLRKGQPLGIKEIKDLIGSQDKRTAFVEYYITNEKIFIFVMRSDEKVPKVEVVYFSSDELLSHTHRYHTEIVDTPGIEETWQELSGKLVEPIFNYIEGCELIYLIPYGLLHYLPLHAILIKDRQLDRKKRLIEYFPIVYLPSLTILKYAQIRNFQCLKPCISIGYTPYDYQKEVFEGEAKLVAKQFNVEPILGDMAKSDVLKNVSSNVIHASCHGGFDLEDPFNSGLILKDGILTAREIFQMNIKTNLLVLSACQTGLNSQKSGDDLVGLTRAFLYAGARSLIVSLWSVESRSTYEYMKNFYKELNQISNKAEALQQIQVDFINGKYGDVYSHPYFWAPFIMIGDWK